MPLSGLIKVIIIRLSLYDGTSIANISQFYGHATDEMKRKAVLKTEDRNAFNFSEAEKVEYNSI
tara:strand:- start:1 stop:192 length:192 start_codon:yes stop_codon:yes gene_type:complete